MEDSLYTRLDAGNFEIRILTILPGESASRVECRLTTSPLQSSTGYAALSYCWGDLSIRRPIRVNDIEIQVTNNLDDALQQLRSMKIGSVWVDAICINQDDTRERSDQVRLMRLIYERATTTYAWLGKDDPDHAVYAINFLQSLALSDYVTNQTHVQHLEAESLPIENGYPLDNLTLPSTSNAADPVCRPAEVARSKEAHDALFRLLDREYWKRRWIIQELVVSPRTLVLCGNQAITLNDLHRALQQCQTSQSQRGSQNREWQHYATVAEIRKRYQQGRLLTLFEVIIKTEQFKSEDIRDKIYSLIGISSDGPRLVPMPTYQNSIGSISTSLTRALIWERCSLDVILAHHSTSDPVSGLPSWVPDWFNVAPFSDAAINVTRKRGELDRNTFLPHWSQIEENVLSVRGRILGRVIDQSHPLTRQQTASEVTSIDGDPIFKNEVKSSTAYYHKSNVARSAILYCLTATRQKKILYSYESEVDYAWNFIVWNDLNVPGRGLWIHLRRCLMVGLHLCEQVPIQGSAVEVGPKAVGWRHIGLFDGRPTLRRLGSYPMLGYASSGRARGIFGAWIRANGHLVVENKALIEWFVKKPYWVKAELWLKFIVPLIVLAIFSICALYAGINYDIDLLMVFGVLALLFLALLLGALWARAEFHVDAIKNSRDTLQKGLSQSLESSGTPLFVSDMGFIGNASGQTQVGDEVALLVGCNKAVVLRRQEGLPNRHKIVGSAFVYLSRSDRKIHRDFACVAQTRVVGLRELEAQWKDGSIKGRVRGWVIWLFPMLDDRIKRMVRGWLIWLSSMLDDLSIEPSWIDKERKKLIQQRYRDGYYEEIHLV